MNYYVWAVITMAGLLGLVGMTRVPRRRRSSWE